MMNIRPIVALFALAVSLAPSYAAAQADFPVRPVRLMVGFPPGGSTDVLARTLAHESRKLLGQEVLVINKPGATGSIAANEVAAAAPDGYTIGITPSTTLTLAHLFQNIRPDLLESTSALLLVGRQRIGIATKGDSPFRSLKELIAYARDNPGKVSIGVPGTGTMVDLLTRAVLQQDKVDVNVVSFQGDSPVATAILGGHIAAGSFAAGAWTPYVREGSMRLLAAIDERADVALDVPTLAELGYPLSGAPIQYMYAPKGLPAPVSKRLTDAFTEASRSPTYVDVATKNTMYDKNAIAGEALDRYLLKDRASITDLVAKLGLKKK
jgi:tripartite-type tricarboxylate transporter receptor subunit TctC